MARRKLASATSATSPAYPDWHGTSQSDSSPRVISRPYGAIWIAG